MSAMSAMAGEWGSYVRAGRRARGLSLRGLADRAGVSKSAIGAWETGRALPSLPELDAVLASFGAGADERLRLLATLDAPRARREMRLARVEPFGSGTSELGDLLRALRVRRGWTMRETAATMGVPPSTLSRWESGDAEPSADRLERLTWVLGARPEERAALADEGSLRGAAGTDLDAIARTLLDVRHWDWSGPPCASSELRLVAAISVLWPLAGRSEVAEDLYRQACTLLAFWFMVHHDALDEAVVYARRAVAGDRGDLRPHITAWPLHILAKSAAYGQGRRRPAEGARMLREWLPRISDRPVLSEWYRRDMAAMVLDAGDPEVALALSRTAVDASARLGVDDEHASFDHACLLLKAARPAEAMEYIPVGWAKTPLQRGRTAAAWADALLATGERSLGESRLAEARAIAVESGIRSLALQVAALERRQG